MQRGGSARIAMRRVRKKFAVLAERALPDLLAAEFG